MKKTVRLNTFQLTHTSQVPKRTTDAVGKANGFLKMLLSFELLAYAHFMTDVMNVLSTLSLFLQYEQAKVSEVYLKVLTTIAVLEQFKNK